MADTLISAQLREFRAEIPPTLLKRWEKPTGCICAMKILQDWAIVFAGHQLFIRHPSTSTFLLALAFMAWGQRGLSTLAHDSIHWNLFASKRANEIVADVLLAPPALSTARLQRLSHAVHHQCLGTMDDPDHGEGNATSLRHYREKRYQHQRILSLFVYDVLDPTMFRQFALGSVHAAPVQILGWWACVTLLTSVLEGKARLTLGPVPLNSFLVIFHIARCTIGYASYVLSEITDHSGLPSGSILQFTRSLPWGPWFQKYLQPHDDNYHLVHHLLPKVPMSNLHEADAWLKMNVEVYRKANHFETYFVGHNALFRQPLHESVLAREGNSWCPGRTL